VDRAKSGRYHAPPVRRVYIDKPGKSEKRPLGIPTTEDKLLQKAVTMLLEPIYGTSLTQCRMTRYGKSYARGYATGF
jgi:retron-type reverse transcriptase